MPLTREQSNYINTGGTLFFPSVAIDNRLGVLGDSLFSGNAQFIGNAQFNNTTQFIGNTQISGMLLALNGSGTNGQILQSTGTGIQWSSGLPAITAILNTSDATTIDTVSLSSFTTIEYTLSIKQGTKVRSSKVLVQNNGSTVDFTEYSIMSTGGAINGITVAVSLSSTNSILQVTVFDALVGNATVKFIKSVI
jgi:hypothetical protein